MGVVSQGGDALADRIALEYAESSVKLPDAVASAAARRAALSAFARVGVPTQREDVWKYSNLRALERARFAPAHPASGSDAIAAAPAPIPGYARYVFIDGQCAADLSHSTTAGGFLIRSALERRPQRAHEAHLSPNHRFAWLNEAFATDIASIGIPPDLEMPACIELVFIATSDAARGASYPRVEVHVGADSELCLIERHLSALSAQNLVNSVVRLALERGAVCQHHRIQQLGSSATWLDTLDAHVGEEANYQLRQVAFGAESSRSTLEIELAGERAQVSLDAVALASGGQVQDTYALVKHSATHTKTRERFRGIAGERSRAAFNGKIVVAREARGADSQQSLRGLISGTQAEVDVRPQLEIYTDDVRCAHGATVGKLDDAMLFYLLSRGLDRDAADRLLKWAFIADVVARIEVSALRNELEAALARRVE